MIRFLQMLTTLVAFVAVMTVLGVVIHSGADTIWPWLVQTVGLPILGGALVVAMTLGWWFGLPKERSEKARRRL